MVVYRTKWRLYSGKSGYIRAKVVVFDAKVVVFGQSGCIRVKSGCIRDKFGCMLARLVVFGQKWLYSVQR